MLEFVMREYAFHPQRLQRILASIGAHPVVLWLYSSDIPLPPGPIELAFVPSCFRTFRAHALAVAMKS